MIKFADLEKDSAYSPRRRYCRLAVNVAAIGLLMLIFTVLPMKNSNVQLIWTMCVFALMAMSLNVTMGLMGQLSLGQCGFMAVGAYTGTYIAYYFHNAGVFKNAADGSYYLVFLVALIGGALAAGIVGLVVGIPALRLRGDYLAILTLGFGLIVVSVLNNIVGPTINSDICRLYISSKLQGKFLWLIILVTAVSIALIFTFGRSKYGRALMSLRDNEIASTASGINASYYKTVGFVFSAAMAGVAGVLYAAMMSSLATSSFAFTSPTIYNSVFIVVMVVMGGMGSLTGSVVTGAGMVYINSLISSLTDVPVIGSIARFPMLLYAIVLIIFIMFRPRGIFGNSEFSLYNTILASPRFFKNLPANTKAFVKNFPKNMKTFGQNVKKGFLSCGDNVKSFFKRNGGADN